LTPSDRRIAAGLFVLTFVTYAYFFSGGGWNQNAHFDLARALVERQTLHVDGYHENTGDVAVVGGHVYINKPPGVSFLAAIPYAVLYAIERALDVPTEAWKTLTLNAWLVTVLTCGVTGALIPAVLYLYGRRRAGASPLAALGVALAVAFGTIVFPYSTMLFAHVPPALFLLLAFVWVDERPLAGGIAAGIAGISYYLCIPAAVVLLVGAWLRGGAKSALRFALGGLPFGVLLIAYHMACFGSPFVTSLEVSRAFTEEGLLLGVFRRPSLEALWGLTFGEYRGLFFVSPVLLIAFLGMTRMPRRPLALIGAILAIFFFAVASFKQWPGGWAFGPRYVLPIVPLLAIPMCCVRGRVTGLVGLGLGLVSFAIQFVATAVSPMPSSSIVAPVQEYLVPRFLAGETSVNEQSIDERVPHRRYAPGSRESTWASFNLGELAVGPSNTLSLLPLAIWVLMGSALLVRRAAAP
jgi:hypothetical protein